MAEDADAVDTATATTSPGSPTSGDPPPPPPDPGQHPSPPPSAVAVPVDAAPLPSPESPNLDVPLQIDEDASPPPSPPPRAPSPLFPSSWNRKRLADGSTLNGHGNPDREVDRDRHWDRDRDLNATKKGAEGETPSPTVDRRRSSEGREEQSEEEKIREYLGRSDTAVIYPEPVEPTKAPVAPDGEAGSKRASPTRRGDTAKHTAEGQQLPRTKETCGGERVGEGALGAAGARGRGGREQGAKVRWKERRKRASQVAALGARGGARSGAVHGERFPRRPPAPVGRSVPCRPVRLPNTREPRRAACLALLVCRRRAPSFARRVRAVPRPTRDRQCARTGRPLGRAPAVPCAACGPEEDSPGEQVKERLRRVTGLAAAGATADSPRMLGELFLRCSHCERSFTGPTAVAALRDHLMCAHSDPRGKALCPLSPPDLKAADQASPDLNGLTSTAFVCAKCNATFSKKEHLDKHDLLHNPAPAGQDENAVLRKFKCTEPTCGKAFKFKHHLKEHMRIHSGEKPFECQHCRKRFSHSGSYSSHMTSKKCLIVNLKVRKMDTKAARGRASNGGSQNNNNNNNTFRPIIPKFGAGGEVSVSPLAGSGPFLYDRFPFSAPDYGHSQSAPGGGGQGSAPQPFPSPYASPLALHHLLATQFPGSALPAHYLPLAPTYNEMAQILQARTAEKCGPPVGNGSSKTPSVDYVKKMFEFMECAAVKQDNGSPPPASKKNGLLPELLAAGPLHSSGADEPGRYPSSCRRDYRCRHCKTASFDSPLALYQHERFMCSANRDVNRNLVQDLKVPKTEPGHESSSSDTNCDSGDEGELRSCKISEKGAMLLDTAFFINPSPGKKDIASLAQAIGSSTRAVRAWFENASKRPSSRASSYSPTSVPAKSVDFRSLLPASYAPGSAFGDAEPSLKSPRSNPPNDAEQPLDLSVKSKSGPSWSNGADSDNEYEALNLSRKSPRTSTPREGYHPASNGHSAVPERHLSPSARSFAPYAASEDYKMSLLHRHSPSPLLPVASKYLALSALKGYDLDGQVDLHRYRESFADRQQHGFPPVFSEPSSVAGLLLASPHAALSPPSADFIRSSTSSDSHDGTASPHGASNLCDGKMAVSPYYHDDPIDGEPGSPKMKAFQRRAFKQGELGSGAGDDSVAEDSPSTDDDPRQPGAKKRKLSARGDSASEEGMFSCDQCDKMFSKQSSLARHKYEHSGQRPHKCDVCEKAFKHKHHLTEHKRLHSGEKPFQCQKCLKRFSHSGSYSQHMNHRFSYCKPYRENGK